MTIFAPIASFGWIPVTIVLFASIGPRRAAAASLILGWLFLPGAVYNFPGIPPVSKITAVCFPIIFATALFDKQRFGRLSPTKLDIPMLIWCFCPLVTSISNGLGLYDGISGITKNVLTWGFSYAIGKMYFSSYRGLRVLGTWIVIGGLIYIPFCIWEIRMAPTLNYYIYGFRSQSYSTSIRFGGYRPIVFMQHGLALGVWMMSALLTGVWLWRTKVVPRLLNFPMGFNVLSLFIVFLLCRSLNAILLFCAGIFSYHAIRSLGFKVVILCIAVVPVFYIVSRDVGILSTERLTNYASIISSDRARSLYGRLYHEERLVEKAWQRPLFGWGGWGRNRVYNAYGEDTSVTDGLWIIAFGVYGLVGLVSLGMILLLPTFAFYRKYHVEDWAQAQFTPMVAFITILPLYTIDCLMNAFVNPIFTVVSGGMLGWLATDARGNRHNSVSTDS